MDNSNQNQTSMAEKLPAGYVTIQSILNLSSGALQKGSLVNVIGVLNDFQAPKKSGGTDHMCTLGIADNSVDDQTNSIKFVVFGPQDKMPQQVNRAALVIIKKAKAQLRNGSISLLSSWVTEYYITKSEIASKNLTEKSPPAWSSYGPKSTSPPSAIEIKHALWLHSKSEDMDLPSDTEFETKIQVSTNFKDKFRLLRELQDTGRLKGYADIIGQVVKIHDGTYEKLELYLTDYTPNEGFFNYVWGAKEGETSDIDAYGYRNAQPQRKKSDEWPGPYGKHTIQVTLWDPHASYTRNKVKVGMWVQVSNVKIKNGPQGFLEGALHFDDVIKVAILKHEALSSSSSLNEVRLQEAIKRKLKWTKDFEKQQKAYNEKLAAGPNGKRNRDEEEELDPRKPGKSLNSKKRRKLERIIAEKKAQEDELEKEKLRNLNQNISCIFPAKEATSIKEILKPKDFKSGDKSVYAPFTNTKYRANVRVVDYFPSRLEDFAVGWRQSEFDSLSDFSGEEDTDTGRDMKAWRSGQGHPKDRWEWRFALEVEDAESEDSGAKMWLIVDNSSAQMLLNLEDDATSLRNNPELLEQVREQLFKLWGDLEERKSASLPKEPTRKSYELVPSSIDSDCIASSPPPRPGGDMPTSTDSDQESSQQPRNTSNSNSKRSALIERNSNFNSTVAQGKGEPLIPVKNKGFACCIQQYGVKVDEEDKSKANAGEGKRWQRMFGLHGTMIK